MSALWDKIREAGIAGHCVVSDHAFERLGERLITEWQILEGLPHARLLRERPEDWPNPIVEVEQVLPDGTPIKVVWAWLRYDNAAKLVTVHYVDR